MNDLKYHLLRFRRRLRLIDGWIIAQRTFWMAALFCLLIQIAGRLAPIPGIRAYTLIPVLVWLVAVVSITLLKPMPLLQLACRVDRELDLKERLSTALAFQTSHEDLRPLQSDWALAVDPLLENRQRLDALSHAVAVTPSQAFPLDWLWRPLAIAGALLSITLASILLPNQMDLRIQERLAIQQAAQQQAQRVEDLKKAVQDSQELSPEAREELQRQLDELAKALQKNPGDLEQALADLSRFDEQLQRELDPNFNTRQAFLDALATRLSQMSAGTENSGEQSTPDSAQQALDQLMAQVENMDETQREQLARELAQMAAQASQTGDAQLSQALASIAQSLQNGDLQGARQSAQAAQAALGQLNQQLADQNALQAALAQSQASRQALAQTGRQVAQGQAQSGGQSPGTSPGANPGPGQAAGAGGGTKANQLPPFRGGRTNLRSPQGDAPTAQAGLLDDQVYAPWQRAASNGDQMFIQGQDTGDGETTTTESQGSKPGLANPALTPYQQVLPQYLNAANQAMQQDYIPGDLLDYVRQYFSSLESR